MKMTLRDRIIVLTLLLFVMVYGGYQLLWVPLGERISALEQSKSEMEGLTADITPLLRQSEAMSAETKRLQESIDTIKKMGDKTLTKEEFLLYLGKCATAGGVKLLGFSDLGEDESNGIYKAKFNFELQGSASSLNTVLSDIDRMGVKYSVGSVSYRQLGDYDFLKRFFDAETNLPWCKEPENQDGPEQQTEEPLFPEEMPFPSLPDTTELFPTAPKSTPPDVEPIPTPDTPAPSEESKEKSITERLDELLEQTSQTVSYQVVFLTNIPDDLETVSGQEMRLAVTICFLMFEKPGLSNSFMTEQAEGI